MNSSNKKAVQIIVAIFIIFIAYSLARYLEHFRKPVKRESARRVVPVVRVMKVSSEPQKLILWEYATIKPVKRVDLVSQVSGRIIRVSPRFKVGGMFSKGEEILKIDPTDYELAIKAAEAEVKQAESALERELAEAEVSRREWTETEGTKKVPRLVARKPQIEAARANLSAARARLKKAKLDLSRTTIKAPFDCLVMSKHVDVGQYVTPARVLGTVFYSGKVEATVFLRRRDIKWIIVPGLNAPTSESGSEAVVRFEMAGQKIQLLGKVVRWNGFLDRTTRLVPVVVEIDRPYSRQPPLVVGTFAHIGITGKPSARAFIVPVSVLHANADGKEIVWVVDEESTLRFRKVEVAYKWRGKAYIVSGLKGGELLVTSPLNLVTDGMKVKPLDKIKTSGL